MSGPEREHGTADEGFLTRWSRRKRETAEETALSPAEAPEEAAPALTDADMPPLDSLTEASEYGGFLSPEVSEELRRMALRKLFHSPLCDRRDGLDDYDDDFTGLARLGDLVTAEMRRNMARSAKHGAAQAAAPADEAGSGAPAARPAGEVAREEDDLRGDPDDTSEETL